jgi:hypothetical protein
MTIKNTLRKIIGTGLTLTALALAGCSQRFLAESFHGKFNNYYVTIKKGVDNPKREIFMEDNFLLLGLHSIVAYDSAGDGVFERIYFDGADMKKLSTIRRNLRNSKIYGLANSDSLNAAYNAVLAQNEVK